MSALKNALTILTNTVTPIFHFFSEYASHCMALIGLISILIGGTKAFGLSEEYSKIFTKVWELKFAPVGTDEQIYENRAGSFSDLIWNVYEDLIFPNQGYTLLLYRNEAPPMSIDTIRV